MRSLWEISLFHGASNMCTKVFPNPSGQVVHDLHLVLRIRNPPKFGTIRERYWLLNLAHVFGQHMKPPPKTSNANLISKKPTCLEYEDSICYCGPHDSRHWATPYTNKYLFIHVNYHLVIHKPQYNIRWQPIRVA